MIRKTCVLFTISVILSAVVLTETRNCRSKPKPGRSFIPDRNCHGILNRTNVDGTTQRCACSCRNTPAAGYYCGTKRTISIVCHNTTITISGPLPTETPIVTKTGSTDTSIIPIAPTTEDILHIIPPTSSPPSMPITSLMSVPMGDILSTPMPIYDCANFVCGSQETIPETTSQQRNDPYLHPVHFGPHTLEHISSIK